MHTNINLHRGKNMALTILIVRIIIMAVQGVIILILPLMLAVLLTVLLVMNKAIVISAMY